MTPSIGRLVHYSLSAGDVESIQRDRRLCPHQVDDTGYPGYTSSRIGAPPQIGQVLPALIVQVWADHPTPDTCVNLQVFLDGNDTLWVTSRCQGDGEGEWFVPPLIAPPATELVPLPVDVHQVYIGNYLPGAARG